MSKDGGSRLALPVILIRGFGGLGVEDEKRIAYQGFNDGTVYPQKQGENYIYEGLILRFMKSHWRYQDATNVVGYYSNALSYTPEIPAELSKFNADFFSGHKVVIDPGMALNLLRASDDPTRTLWVFRYYDLNDRAFTTYGEALVRLIDFVRELAVLKGSEEKPKVNIIAHSMGGLIVREAVQVTYPKDHRLAEDHINKIVTLGTPHRGISFQLMKHWIGAAADDMKHFAPEFQVESNEPAAYVNFEKHFPLKRLLTVVGTNYRSYSIGVSSLLNRLFSLEGEFGPTYNRSDGLVKQTSAQIPGAPRTFIHKCHGGFDSLVTARESFEIATRFFFGNLHVSLRLVKAKVKRGMDLFGKSEFFFGLSIKPRRVDFELFHQSPEAENCYGPFRTLDLTDSEVAFPWADTGRLIWEGWLDTSRILKDPSIETKDVVMRLDFYVGERDHLGIGFSDNVIFRKQYYLRALLQLDDPKKFVLYRHTDEQFMLPSFQVPDPDRMTLIDGAWQFNIEGTGFDGTFALELQEVPEAE